MTEPNWVPLGGTPVDYKGAYAPATAYQPGDVVRANGIDYIAVNPSTGSTPPASTLQNVLPVGIGTTLPASPFDGQEYILVDSLTAPTYQWRFRYVAGISDAYKWVFVGGAAPVATFISGENTTTVNTWLNLATNGPLIVAPRAGIYEADGGAGYVSHTAQYATVNLGITAGDGVPPLFAHFQAFGGNALGELAVAAALSGVTQGQQIKLRYLNGTAGTATWAYRWIRVRPVRVA